jgi:hypothetical protein
MNKKQSIQSDEQIQKLKGQLDGTTKDVLKVVKGIREKQEQN